MSRHEKALQIISWLWVGDAEVKRKLLIIMCYTVMFLLTVGIFAVFTLPFLYWKTIEPIPINVWIVDKTVPLPDYREHKGLMWVLNHHKFINNASGTTFSYETDYYGFFPNSSGDYLIKEVPTKVEKPELIYLTDAYGVYKDDYLTDNIQGTRSELIYGGLIKEEIESVKANLGNGNTIIGEFNIAAPPTNAENREELEGIFGLSWTGWSGRYFRDLAKNIEVPVWMVEDYEKQNGVQWDYRGSGIVLISDDEKIYVLEKGKHIRNNELNIVFENKYVEEFGIEGNVPYEYWFEFTSAEPGREILAQYKLDVTDEGQKILTQLGLSSVFPAVIRYKNTQYTSYYFAGDFADANVTNIWWNYYGFDKFRNIVSLGNRNDNSRFYWKYFVPLIGKIVEDIKQKINDDKQIFYIADAVSYNFRTEGKNFQVYNNGQWKDLFIKGVNIGPAVPGKWFTQFPKDEKLYLKWLEMIGEMNANSIRVYTLLPPQFYNALAYYNKEHPQKPLWLFQEIWPEENPPEEDYLKKEYNDQYEKEIQYVIDAVHGKANIPERKGRAYGVYTSDIAGYIAGYLVGRELEPDEVIGTNEKNKGFTYKGKYLYGTDNASPSEAWLAMSCDYVLAYEREKYAWQHPVGIVSWPTLDPVQHDSQWNDMGDKSLEYNDKVAININNIISKDTLKTGLFGAYHIYPNYPDFINNESAYNEYHDEEGRLRYGGYLKEFINGHTKYPALVAEFGLATGMGNAHTSPDGYNHGGLTEEQQGKGIVRMMSAIKREGYAGGLIFEWMDEWAKKTWTTEPFMIPYERHVLWHNAVDPEQNYGILAMEASERKAQNYVVKGNGIISEIDLSVDETYLQIEVDLRRDIDFNKEKMVIGLDTYDRAKGEFRYAQDISLPAPSGLEYIIEINSRDDAKLLVHPGYNAAKGKYSSYASYKGEFEEAKRLINKEVITKDDRKISAIYSDESRLRFGELANNSYNNWYIQASKIFIRIPWTRINYTDPSSMTVLHDNSHRISPERDQLNTVVSDGILVSGLLIDLSDKRIIDGVGVFELVDDEAFRWENWDIPVYKERLKESYYIIKEYFSRL